MTGPAEYKGGRIKTAGIGIALIYHYRTGDRQLAQRIIGADAYVLSINIAACCEQQEKNQVLFHDFNLIDGHKAAGYSYCKKNWLFNGTNDLLGGKEPIPLCSLFNSVSSGICFFSKSDDSRLSEEDQKCNNVF